jgi:hypothetical protein
MFAVAGGAAYLFDQLVMAHGRLDSSSRWGSLLIGAMESRLQVRYQRPGAAASPSPRRRYPELPRKLYQAPAKFSL